MKGDDKNEKVKEIRKGKNKRNSITDIHFSRLVLQSLSRFHHLKKEEKRCLSILDMKNRIKREDVNRED
jgi:hypothetical protein